jgi:hypothetical protein
MDINRRKTLAVICTSAAVAALSSVRGLHASTMTPTPATAVGGDDKVKHTTFPYMRLDPVTTAERAYDNYYRGECMYAVFASIVEELADKVGEPFSSHPTTFTRYGAGGVMGWGSLCGALNGAAMAIYLVSKDPEPAINDVLSYYGRTALPDYHPVKAKYEVPTSVSESTLCHVSVSRWCDASGKKSFSPERSDRCAQLSASVAKRTVEVLNAQLDGTFEPDFALPSTVAACRGCHDKGGRMENTRGKDDCLTCHEGFEHGHP